MESSGLSLEATWKQPIMEYAQQHVLLHNYDSIIV